MQGREISRLAKSRERIGKSGLIVTFSLSVSYTDKSTMARRVLKGFTMHWQTPGKTQKIPQNTMKTQTQLNGLDSEVMRASIEAMRQEPAQAQTHWSVATTWRGGTRSDTRVTHTIGEQNVERDFTI